MLTREDILSKRDFKTQSIEVPEWGGNVLVRELDGAGRDELDSFLAKRADKDGKFTDMSGFRGKVCALSMCDGNGKRVFADADIPALESKSAVALQRVFDAAAKINSLTSGATEAARENF